MAVLKIGKKEYEAKTNFKFERVANKKYKEGDTGGFLTIYFGLLQFNTDSLSQFWDCALAYLKEDKPDLEKIEEALEARIDEDGDTEKLLNEAFGVLDQSGFFKKQAKSTWKELTNVPKAEKDETEEQKKKRQDQEEMAKMMTGRYNELTGQTLTK